MRNTALKNLLIRTWATDGRNSTYATGQTGLQFTIQACMISCSFLAESDFSLNFEFRNVILNSHFLKKCIYFYILSSCATSINYWKVFGGMADVNQRPVVIKQKCGFCRRLLFFLVLPLLLWE